MIDKKISNFLKVINLISIYSLILLYKKESGKYLKKKFFIHFFSIDLDFSIRHDKFLANFNFIKNNLFHFY